MKTYVFPGQGSQAVGMGAELFDRFPELVSAADKILGYSIKELCLEDPREELNNTQFTQPALYTVNALSYYAKLEDTGIKPDYVAGHSLGEFNALLAAEVYDFEAGLKIVKKRGELMSQAAEGGMAAILNMPVADIERTLQENNLDQIDIANLNTFNQIVISGAKDQIAAAEPVFAQGRVRFFPLNTSGAFHSRFMQPLQDKFTNYLKKFKLRAPQIPVIANVSAELYTEETLVSNLSSQMASGVRWSDSMAYLLKLAARNNEEAEIEEIGFGDVLTRMTFKIRQETKADIEAIRNGEAVEAAATVATTETAAQDKAPAAANQPAWEPAKFSSAADKVRAWNQQFPVGARVRSTALDYDVMETRSEATLLFGHRAAVYMQGYNGYFDLDELASA